MHDFFLLLSDLQFSLTTLNASAKNEADLRDQLQRLQEESELKDQLVGELRTTLKAKTDRQEELEGQLKWKELDFKNQLESKEAKIEQLQKSLAKQNEVGKLQNQVKELYVEREAELQTKLTDVTRRARTPSSKLPKSALPREERRPSTAASMGPKSWDQLLHESQSHTDRGLRRSSSIDHASIAGSTLSLKSNGHRKEPIIKKPPNASSTRSKVFRHMLPDKGKKADYQHDLENNNSKSSVENRPLVRRRHSNTGNVLVYSIDELPGDYKSAVATLPPILSGSGGAKELQATHHQEHRERRRHSNSAMSRTSGLEHVSEVEYEITSHINTDSSSGGGNSENDSNAKALGESFA